MKTKRKDWTSPPPDAVWQGCASSSTTEEVCRQVDAALWANDGWEWAARRGLAALCWRAAGTASLAHVLYAPQKAATADRSWQVADLINLAAAGWFLHASLAKALALRWRLTCGAAMAGLNDAVVLHEAVSEGVDFATFSGRLQKVAARRLPTTRPLPAFEKVAQDPAIRAFLRDQRAKVAAQEPWKVPWGTACLVAAGSSGAAAWVGRAAGVLGVLTSQQLCLLGATAGLFGACDLLLQRSHRDRAAQLLQVVEGP